MGNPTELGLEDRRIQLHRQMRNVGARKNFFDVLAMANTEFFMWHAHDDCISPNFLEELVKVMDQNPGCQLAAPSLRWRDPNGTEIQYWPFPDLDVRSPLERARRLLEDPVAGWVYGLFRTDSLRQALHHASGFQHVLAFDRVLLLQFILADTLRGARNAEMSCLITDRTQQDYLPNSLYKQLHIIADYLIEHGKSIARSPFPLNTKAKLIGPLLTHRKKTFYVHWSAVDNVGVRLFFRLRDVRRNPYRFLVKRPARWLVSQVTGSSSSSRSSARQRSRQDAPSHSESGSAASPSRTEGNSALTKSAGFNSMD